MSVSMITMNTATIYWHYLTVKSIITCQQQLNCSKYHLVTIYSSTIKILERLIENSANNLPFGKFILTKYKKKACDHVTLKQRFPYDHRC